jgi:hypothetical protein
METHQIRSKSAIGLPFWMISQKILEKNFNVWLKSANPMKKGNFGTFIGGFCLVFQ